MRYRNTKNRISPSGRFITITTTLLLLSSCSTHGSGSNSPAKRGLPGQTIDAVVAEIHEENRGDDVVGITKHQKFQVFMTGLPDETGKHTDSGLIVLSGYPS